MTRSLQHILIVEDEADIRLVARVALETVGGFVVDVCSCGTDALTFLDNTVPDLILLDVMMPGMDGTELFSRLQDMEPTRLVPVVFMTAKAQTSDLQRYAELGAAGVIPKPFNPMSLAEQLVSIWEESLGTRVRTD